MIFEKHSNLAGHHATLSASKYHWLNYDDSKMADVYMNMIAVQRGTELHELAERCIKLKQKLPKTNKTLNMYVNDAIGYRMTPEQILYYSDICFGTADAISFKKNLLRIHDLKTGKTPAHMEQLFIYAALFCLEYRIKPGDIQIETRIYQNDEILIDSPTVEDILPIMDKIKHFDRLIRDIRDKEES